MKINHQLKRITRVLIILSVLFFNVSTLMAVAFPFREFDQGDFVPDVTLQPMENGKTAITFSELKGEPFIVVFWGADLPEKIERSAEILKDIETLSPFLRERNVQRFSVNVQNDSPEAIKEVVNKSKSTIDIFIDANKKAYATLGIFVMPTVLLVDKDGKVAAGLGYSRDLIDRLRGSVELMLGEKTVEQVAAELRPEMQESSDEEKSSRRHYNFGMVMMKRGQIETAIREFEKAVEVDPGMSEAHLQIGCLYLGKNDYENAEKAITKALAADPQSIKGMICRGELLRLMGQLDEAAKQLQSVIDAHPDSYNAYYYLGRIFEDQKKDKEAMALYKKAYKSILEYSVMRQ